MLSYIAHYRTPHAATKRTKGIFEFESEAKCGSKANAHDARLRMLELFGKRSLSWVIDRIERKGRTEALLTGQLELDFREPYAKSGRKSDKKASMKP